MTAEQPGLRGLLGETGAYREGHFEVSPSQHVLSYFNCERLFQYPTLASRAAAYLVDSVTSVGSDMVFTPSISAQVLAFEVARRMDLQYISHALPFTDDGFAFEPGTRVLVVEDVVVSGRSLRHAKAWLEQRGANVTAYAVLVDRRPLTDPGAGALSVRSVLVDPVQVYDPSVCPACRDGLPVSAVQPNYPERSATS